MSQTDKAADDADTEHVQFSTDVGYFDKFLEALETMRDDGRLVFTDESVYSKVADPSNVAMCISRVKGQALNSLSLNNTEKIEVGVDFGKMREMLKSVSNTSELRVTYPIGRGAQRLFRLEIVEENLEFDLPALDPQAVPEPDMTDPLSHSTQVVLSGSELKSAIKHAQKIPGTDSYAITFATEDGTFKLKTDDKVDGRFSKEFNQSGPSEEPDLPDHTTMISLNYVEEIDKVLGRGNEVTLHIKDDHPVRFDVELDDTGDATVIYIIAPRIE